MSFSLFSHKQSSPQASPNKTSSPVFAIRTMRDDLEGVKNGEPEFPPTSSADTAYPTASTPSIEKISLAVNPFNVEKEALPELRDQEDDMAQNSPFGVFNETMTTPSATDFSKQPFPIMEKGLGSLVPEGSILVNQQGHSKKKLWLGILVVIILWIIAGGAWYFFFGGKEKIWKLLPFSSVNQKVTEMSKILEIPEVKPMPKLQPFSSDKPNYLSFNTETVSPEDIRATFSQVASSIQTADISEPIEFLLTDQNNNPLALSRFVYLFQLDLNPEILALAMETFSLYAYDDTGTVRFGMVLDFKEDQAATAVSLIEKTESGLPYALRALFLKPDINIDKKLTFQSSDYDQFHIRFANIDINQKIALDYAFYGNRFFIGTSKSTLRAMLDANKSK
jgi:hypothetical protein